MGKKGLILIFMKGTCFEPGMYIYIYMNIHDIPSLKLTART